MFLVEVLLTNKIASLVVMLLHQLEAEQTAANLGVQQYDALLLHGDMEQADRNKVITAFKRNENNILVATDVAGTLAFLIVYYKKRLVLVQNSKFIDER